jgi:hypothetical protein
MLHLHNFDSTADPQQSLSSERRSGKDKMLKLLLKVGCRDSVHGSRYGLASKIQRALIKISMSPSVIMGLMTGELGCEIR